MDNLNNPIENTDDNQTAPSVDTTENVTDAATTPEETIANFSEVEKEIAEEDKRKSAEAWEAIEADSRNAIEERNPFKDIDFSQIFGKEREADKEKMMHEAEVAAEKARQEVYNKYNKEKPGIYESATDRAWRELVENLH